MRNILLFIIPYLCIALAVSPAASNTRPAAGTNELPKSLAEIFGNASNITASYEVSATAMEESRNPQTNAMPRTMPYNPQFLIGMTANFGIPSPAIRAENNKGTPGADSLIATPAINVLIDGEKSTSMINAFGLCAGMRLMPYLEFGLGYGLQIIETYVAFNEKAGVIYSDASGGTTTAEGNIRFGYKSGSQHVYGYAKGILPLTDVRDISQYLIGLTARYAFNVYASYNYEYGYGVPDFPDSYSGSSVPSPSYTTYTANFGNLIMKIPYGLLFSHSFSGGTVFEFGYFGISVDAGAHVFMSTPTPGDDFFFINSGFSHVKFVELYVVPFVMASMYMRF